MSVRVADLRVINLHSSGGLLLVGKCQTSQSLEFITKFSKTQWAPFRASAKFSSSLVSFFFIKLLSNLMDNVYFYRSSLLKPVYDKPMDKSEDINKNNGVSNDKKFLTPLRIYDTNRPTNQTDWLIRKQLIAPRLD